MWGMRCGAGSKSQPSALGAGRYFAHLHFEMREFITPFIGPGYAKRPTAGWIRALLSRNIAGAPEDDVGRTTSHPERKSMDPAAEP